MNKCIKTIFRKQNLLVAIFNIKLLTVAATSLTSKRSIITTSVLDNTNKMTLKRVVPTISEYSDFNKYLGDFLNKDDKLTLMLDYDGTLAAIAPNPNMTAMSKEVENSLKKFAVHPNIFLGVISGRGLEDVKNKVGIPNITYGGNHGLEIENPDGSRSDFQLDGELKEKYQKMVQELNEKVRRNGAWNEDKLVSLTFHYRDVPEEMMDDIKTEAIKIIKSYGFKPNQAHYAIEAKPPVNWHKGEALKFILNKNFGDGWQHKTKVIFAGDDTTDEDAMEAVQGKGKSFRITDNPNFETYADYRLPNQNMMPELIKWIENIYYK
ncbi:uncharacterized protein LOC129606099 [Condylostylus longicornis]|uniref:uncharacterized protein LOC129606099 n=1 Tax=Condylostylus longicornis TaxID=2530218 RepID=UPI00244E4FD5|nr:uncharacterized protein LOC129606099 [Condylostylus longicornis]